MADRRGRMSTPAWVMDFTSNAAETFVTAYYAASDSPQRTQVRSHGLWREAHHQLLPSLYLPTSSISWNGNPISGAAQYGQLLDAQPGSKHEIQSFDCHPLSACVTQGTYGCSGAQARVQLAQAAQAGLGAAPCPHGSRGQVASHRLSPAWAR